MHNKNLAYILSSECLYPEHKTNKNDSHTVTPSTTSTQFVRMIVTQ